MNEKIIQLYVSDNGGYVTVPLATGPSKFHAIWLQDNAQNDTTISPVNGQKLLTLQQQPVNPSIRSAQLQGNVVTITMANATSSSYEFDLQWLQNHHYDRTMQSSVGWIDQHAQLWTSTLHTAFPSADFQAIASSQAALLGWLKLIRRYGFAHLTNVGSEPGSLLNVTELFGYARETNYGKVFDVKTEVDANNLAYTALGLQAHTDNPYRDPVPTMQILACLTNTTSGGQSIVVDGFHAVHILQQEAPLHFDLLSRYCVQFEYRGSKSVHLSAKKPVIEISPDGELTGIRFNNRSIAPFCDVPFNEMENFYAAYRHLNDIIERPEMKLEFRLGSGELFIVDNTRVLHARTGFSSEGSRHLQGCYPDIDGMKSTLAVLDAQQFQAESA